LPLEKKHQRKALLEFSAEREQIKAADGMDAEFIGNNLSRRLTIIGAFV
jgi:hypothetical protein